MFDTLSFYNKYLLCKFYFFEKIYNITAIVGFFIPVSSLKGFGHSIHSERRRIYLGKSIQAWHHYHIMGIQFQGSGGIEKSHSCKWAKWIQWHALPHIQQSTQQRNKGYYPNLHGWDFSIPPLPVSGSSS